MPVLIMKAQRPTSDSELAALEKSLNIQLPTDYRNFLLEYNGGRPKPKTFDFKDSKDTASRSVVNWFLAVYDGPYENFEDTFKTFKVTQRRMPDRLVPIASDPFGNKICISVIGNDRGAVYFWDHEEEAPDGEEADDRNVDLIADSFKEFLEGLYEA